MTICKAIPPPPPRTHARIRLQRQANFVVVAQSSSVDRIRFGFCLFMKTKEFGWLLKHWQSHPFFGHTKILHTLVGMGSLTQVWPSEFSSRDNEVLKYRSGRCRCLYAIALSHEEGRKDGIKYRPGMATGVRNYIGETARLYTFLSLLANRIRTAPDFKRQDTNIST